METDEVDSACGDAFCGKERLDRLGVAKRHKLLGFRERFRPGGAILEPPRRLCRAAEDFAVRVLVGKRPGGAERRHPFAVRLDQRDIDAVEGGAAHQADGPAYLSHPKTPLRPRVSRAADPMLRAAGNCHAP